MWGGIAVDSCDNRGPTGALETGNVGVTEMTAERLSIRELDSICTEFEKSWQPDRELARLIEFAARRVPRDSISFKELLLDLSLIDLEKRWAYRSDRLNLACRRGGVVRGGLGCAPRARIS